jgi:hypothetical protein
MTGESMDFSLTEEQRLLQDTVKRYLGREYTFEQRRKRWPRTQAFPARPGSS